MSMPYCESFAPASLRTSDPFASARRLRCRSDFLRRTPFATVFATCLRSCSYSTVVPSTRVTFTSLVFFIVLPTHPDLFFRSASNIRCCSAHNALSCIAANWRRSSREDLRHVPVCSSDRLCFKFGPCRIDREWLSANVHRLKRGYRASCLNGVRPAPTTLLTVAEKLNHTGATQVNYQG